MAIIYHYCDSNAFLSILKEGKLRLSSTTKMNDVNEGSVVETALKDEINRLGNAKAYTEIDKFIGVLKDEIYACCFSGQSDSTVQWMSYADSGKGFAIGFDTEKLLSIYLGRSEIMEFDSYLKNRPGRLNDTNNLRLSPIIYFTGANRSKIIQLLIDQIKAIGLRNADYDFGYFHIAQTAAWFDTIAKDAGFSHEIEYRLTHTPESLNIPQMLDTSNAEPVRSSILDPLHWRASRYGLAPYYEFSFPHDSVEEVWIGPRNPDHPNVSSQHLIKKFCARNNIPDAIVRMSKSPYRG